jgi:23S rRNA (adenine2503-C2)-methyltransferase
MTADPLNLLSLSKSDLPEKMKEWGWPRYRASQLWHWLYRRRATTFEQMGNLGRALQDDLSRRAVIARPRLIHSQTAIDGTRKLLLELEDGERVESVLIPDGHRLTLCVSTQVGCTLDCGFCLTGTMGLRRNLKAHEIVGQWFAAQEEIGREPSEATPRLTNVVFMGMGEPLANLPQLLEALRRLTDQQGIAFPARRITVSTAGLVPQMAEFSTFHPPVNLAVSLNATTDEVRARLMPMAARYSIDELMAACRAYPHPPRRWITFEYVLLEGINDSPADAKRLVRLLHGIRCKLNLIPWNALTDAPFRRPPEKDVMAFQAILIDHGIPTYVRKNRGREILAACGQLHNSVPPTSRLTPQWTA